MEKYPEPEGLFNDTQPALHPHPEPPQDLTSAATSEQFFYLVSEAGYAWIDREGWLRAEPLPHTATKFSMWIYQGTYRYLRVEDGEYKGYYMGANASWYFGAYKLYTSSYLFDAYSFSLVNFWKGNTIHQAPISRGYYVVAPVDVTPVRVYKYQFVQ